jgi:hypothetical protein
MTAKFHDDVGVTNIISTPIDISRPNKILSIAIGSRTKRHLMKSWCQQLHQRLNVLLQFWRWHQWSINPICHFACNVANTEPICCSHGSCQAVYPVSRIPKKFYSRTLLRDRPLIAQVWRQGLYCKLPCCWSLIVTELMTRHITLNLPNAASTEHWKKPMTCWNWLQLLLLPAGVPLSVKVRLLPAETR